MNGGARAWRLASVLCALVLILDQTCKALVEANLVPGERVDLLGPIELTLAHNEGIAFGLASGGGALLVLLTLFALGVVITLFAREPQRPGMWIAVGLLGGGALGNLVDRLRAGEVTDYIDVLGWPPFNLADVAITFGVAALALIYLAAAEGERA